MGWSSGSSLFLYIIDVIEDTDLHVSEKIDVYQKLIEVFENHDCDTLDECVGHSNTFDVAWNQLYPDDIEDEDLLDD